MGTRANHVPRQQRLFSCDGCKPYLALSLSLRQRARPECQLPEAEGWFWNPETRNASVTRPSGSEDVRAGGMLQSLMFRAIAGLGGF